MSRRWLALGFLAFLTLYGVLTLLTPGTFRLLDNVDLAVHETGHLVFGPFGELLTALGGTLLQLIVPGAFVWYFERRQDRFAGSVALWWVAQNLWNISVYVKDARAQELPLVGGGEHDWAYLLGRSGLLEHDQTIGGLVHLAGVTIFAFAMVRGALAVRRAAPQLASEPGS